MVKRALTILLDMVYLEHDPIIFVNFEVVSWYVKLLGRNVFIQSLFWSLKRLS